MKKISAHSVTEVRIVAHVDAMTPSYDPVIPANISTALLPYEQVGKPVYIWYGSSANADSYWHTCPTTNDANFPTQPIRASHYAGDQSAMLNASSGGVYPILGIALWSLVDSGTPPPTNCSGETTNWGLLSNKDNAYDGTCAVIASSTDPWGYGGETANYGDFLNTVTLTNSTSVQQVITEQLK